VTIPYDGQPRHRFWKASAAGADAIAAEFDAGRKFAFAREDSFAPAGSCFAQHFARELAARGGRVIAAEARHPLEPADRDLGYGVFPARFGNIYTARHLRELLEQALGEREAVRDFARREDGRWVDQLRPRALPAGFASQEHARADRDYHLTAVRRMVESMGVFVFTLGLTETWENAAGGYAYPIVPGAVAGTFDAAMHRFVNARVADVVADLERVVTLVATRNAKARILLTVSPVGLAATAEARSVMVSTAASKSILRAAADELVRSHAHADYFPSFEIITGAWARGRFWAEGLREVSAAGVEAVMAAFMASRLPDLAQAPRAPAAAPSPAASDPTAAFAAALDAECDERFLDRS
jgi:hypothetical protein